jgi:Na+/melibiose symporter-like transporter
MALGAELSDDYDERTAIVTIQYLFSRVGHGLTGALGLVVFMRSTAEHPIGQMNPAAYPRMALSVAVIMFLSIMLSAWRTHHRIPYLREADAKTYDRSVLGTLVWDNLEALRNSSFRALFLGNTLAFVGWGVASILGLHMATYFWRVSTDVLLIFGIAAGIGIFTGLPFWRKAAERVDKKPVFMAGLTVFTAFTAAPPFANLLGFWPAHGSALYVPAFVLTMGLVANFGVAACMVTGRSMMADVTDEDALTHGRRREGIFFGAISFTAKASFGLGGVIAGVVVDAVGLVPGAAPDEVGPEVVRGLGITLGSAVLLLCGLSLAFFARYGLTREVHARVHAALRAREAEEGVAAS